MINMVKTQDLTGKVFGLLTVIKQVEDRVSNSGRREAMWLCRCECGNYKTVRATSLRKGNTRSCGCYRSNKSKERMSELVSVHGLSNTRIYKTWRSMIDRCENPKNKSYKNYGARGIKVSEEWHDLECFIAWAKSHGYEEDLTIDRVDSSKGYNANNCRFVDRKVQNNNTRRNHYLEFNGERLTMAQWAEKTGISYNAIKSRINKHGWDIERTLTTPTNYKLKNKVSQQYS